MKKKAESRHYSVRVRAAIIVLAVVLVSTLFATTVGVVFSTREITNTVSSNLRLVGKIASDMIQSAIGKINDDVNYVSGMMERAYEAGGAERLSQTLESEIGPGPNFISMAVIFPDGRVFTAQKQDCEYANPPEKDYQSFLDAAPDEGVRVSDSTITESGEYVIRCYKKINNGVIFIATMRADYFARMITDTNYGIYDSGKVFLVDGAGYVIADADLKMLNKRYEDEEPGLAKVVKDAIADVGADSAVAQYKDDDGGNIVCVYTQIAHGSERWLLFISAPISDTPVPKMRNIFFGSGLIFLALGSISAIFLSAMQAKPYDELDRQNKQLAELKVEAEYAGRAKGDFLSNMSHEIRTPLNAVIGMTAIAKKAKGERRKDECLGKIEEASQHLMGVINDILDMSKIEANKLELAPESFNFEDMLRKVSGVIAFRVEEKRQNYSVDFDTDIPEYVNADEQRLAQVIANLLSNAVKFTPENGEIKLAARLLGKTEHDVKLEISVTDTGIGLSEEQQSKLFQSFQQADASTSRKFGGTGLGLAISKRIVELMDGRIWVDSELGNGSRFAFSVSVGRADTETDADAFSVRGLRILVVEGDEATRSWFARAALRLGAEVTFAPSVAEIGGTYDVYFVDSVSAAAELQKARESAVVILAAPKNHSEEDAAKAAGVKAILEKPFFSSDLLSAVAESLGSATGGSLAVNSADAYDDEFAGKRILLAEDIAINREIVMSLLESTGVTIDEAENGRVALDMYAANPESYDIIFMDVQMPELDGYEATRKIRQMGFEHAETVPIIAMTANVFREDIDRCMEAGMNAHVGKPFELAQITEILRLYLK
ncbi:MAG: response regulator [Oscillospiraceae bacterium]|jgi:signal transduction histidine kinase/CheY-like chemotaxis protein|nr:response regulator [Oscillospiraceae bacterium]